MGIKIGKIIPKKEIRMQDLAGKTVAVDAFNIIYQFLTTIRDKETGEPFKNSKGEVTSHLSGLFYRSINLMSEGIKLVYVFDGKKPSFKKETVAARAQVKVEAEKRLELAVEEGDLEAVRRHAQASSKVTSEMISEAKELLGAMGLPCVQAPSEGEAQASFMAKRGDVYAVVSQDVDSLLFGCPRLVRNLSTTLKRKVPGQNMWTKIYPEIITLSDVLKELDITREQLIILGILIGTDFNPGGVTGLGPVKALALVKKEKTLDNVIKNIEWKFETSPKEIFDFFMSPPVEESFTVAQGQPDIEKVTSLLVDKYEFSKERVENALKRLEDVKKLRQQSSLFGWGRKKG